MIDSIARKPSKDRTGAPADPALRRMRPDAPADSLSAATSGAEPVRILSGRVSIARESFERIGQSSTPAAERLVWRVDQPHLPAAGNRSWSYRAAKRTLDIAGALVLLVLFGPLMLTTLAVLLFTTRGKPLFWQERVGFRGRTFWMLKFRTMVTNADWLQTLVENEQSGPVFKNSHDPRVTRLGRLLRKTSIDELPQLFNVLAGQMSLVGPRPPLAQEVAKYESWQLKRLTVKPGLTCLWQVAGRSEIGFEDWMRMDVWYTENQTLRTDLVLLLRTPGSVLSRRGAY